MPSEDGPAAARAIDDILARFVRYHPDRIDLSLDRMYRLLADLDDPHQKLPPVIHVAGTNGKGSTVAFLRAALEASGQVVSAYTSPHLIRFAERYRIAGGIPDDATLLALFEEIEDRNAGKPITEFEITTAAAFLAFSRASADVVLLEVGLGGRFDATNVVERPLTTSITRIAMDHIDFLGDTIPEIAREKAGIQKPGVPSIIGPQSDAALAVISAHGEAIGAPLYCVGRWSGEADPETGGFTYRRGQQSGPCPNRPARAASRSTTPPRQRLALDICNLPGLTQTNIAEGLAHIDWPGRLQKLAPGALTAILPEDWDIWIDAGHNPSGAQAAAQMFRTRDAADGRPLHLILAMARDKDVPGFLAPFREVATSVTAIPVPREPRIHDPADLAAFFAPAGLTGTAAVSLKSALTTLACQPAPGRILITGSHLAAGAALSANGLDRTGSPALS